ncbi:MAG: malonate transporter subunit MadL [Euryarchaeota archaeon]|nr:malonate transporter subunit MadL [Euryarchaeota archaeon]MBV1756306.1 malonate transporter subunit MadL [Dethiosulfatibacter sp.]
MEIFGFGIVAICMFIGSLLGRGLGEILGVSGNVGGVGFAMLLLVVFSNYRESKGKPLNEKTQSGIILLSALYIPIIVAMSSIQNVVAAFAGGAVAFLAGGVSTIGAMMLIPLISKITASKEKEKVA